MSAHAWVAVLVPLSLLLTAALVLVALRGSTWKHAFWYRVQDEQKANRQTPNSPSLYEQAMREVRRHA